MSILVLVESPGKVKKIQSFLGDDYTVMASCGHIRQLPKDTLGFDIANNFTPEFEIMPDKADIIKKIKSKGKDADKIVLCADGDIEGASIAWHCAEILKLPQTKRLRATFTEITKKAITTAITNTIANNTVIDMNQVYAQFARMVLDKLIGYKISPILWKEFANYHLSCGRVQSPVVRLIAEREAEIAQFASKPFYKLTATFNLANPSDTGKAIEAGKAGKKDAKDAISGELTSYCDQDITEREKIEELYKSLNLDSNLDTTPDKKTGKASKSGKASNPGIIWSITSITKTQSKRNPPPPFITSTLQQEASARLGMSPDICMKTAQKLYEAGLITYMRTDAVFIAEDAQKALQAFIEKKWGNEYYRRVNYKTKSASAQEAHECCRPVDVNKLSALGAGEGMTGQHNRLYQLIWRRTVASQMAPADIETHTAKINSDPASYTFITKYEKILFEGFLAVKPKPSAADKKTKASVAGDAGDDVEDDADSDSAGDDAGDDISAKDAKDVKSLEILFEKLKEGMPVWVNDMHAEEKYTKPPHARYTEASLIKKLDDLGIGRPSTYATMIKKVQEEQRQYVEKKTLQPKKIKITMLDYKYPNVINIIEKDGKIEGDRNKLFPTPLGMMINEYLEKNFLDIINYEITAQIEGLLDEIAHGAKVWYKVVDSVYIKLNPIIDELSRAITTRKQASAATPEADNENRRLLGMHPETQLPVYAIKSRKGFLICESNPEKTKSRFANFTGRFDSMTLEKALALLVFPRILGKYEEHDVILKKAKNIYLACNGINYSIDSYIKMHVEKHNEKHNAKHAEKDEDNTNIDPANITIDEAVKIIKYYSGLKTATAENAKKDRQLRDDVMIKVGPYGPYIKYQGSMNIPLPKKLKDKWETITIEECEPVIEKGKGRAAAKAKGTVKGKTKPGSVSKGKGKNAAPMVEPVTAAAAAAPLTLDYAMGAGADAGSSDTTDKKPAKGKAVKIVRKVKKSE